jgi:hypothetical protein
LRGPPCREQIVIDGKYLRKGGYEAAQSQIAIFQAAVTVASAVEASALAMYIAAKTANRQPALNLADDN